MYPGMTTAMRSAVAAGTINPGDISIYRSIVTPPPAPTNVDVAVFSDVGASDAITENPNGSITVNHNGGTATDGIDTLWNIERVRFTDLSIGFGPFANTAATGTANINDGAPTEDQTLSVNRPHHRPRRPRNLSRRRGNRRSTGPGRQVHVGNTFTPSDGQVGLASAGDRDLPRRLGCARAGDRCCNGTSRQRQRRPCRGCRSSAATPRSWVCR